MEIVNAKITSVDIEIEDHGILTARLNLSYGNSVQSFGNRILYNPKFPSPYAGAFIWRCLEVLDERKWDNLSGKVIRVKRENGLVVAIGHPLEDNWFCPDVEWG